MGHYENLATPPKDALKKISGHPRLNGKTDINPQWRYEALTNEYGEYGHGWYVDVVNTFTQDIPDTHELMIFATVNLYVKQGEEWSKPAVGFGGDYLIRRTKNGIGGNDEGYKMAVTDAIGTAAKLFGVAADVYRGKMENGYSDSKYAPRESQDGAQWTNQPNASNTKAQQKATPTANVEANNALVNKLKAKCSENGLTMDDVKVMAREHYGKKGWKALTQKEKEELAERPLEIWDAVMRKLGAT